MSVIAEYRTVRHGNVARSAVKGPGSRLALVIAFAFGIPLIFYLSLLALLVITYGHWPNYVTPYNWITNALHIIASTRSVVDIPPIILDEWLLEIGHINYDYGRGIADWSLTIIPHKLVIVALAGALVGLNVALLLEQQTTGTLAQQAAQLSRFGLLTSAGALCATITNATVFSVVHCATPSWVGSLAVLGFDSYDVFAIEPFGSIICILGFAALVVSALLIIRDNNAAANSGPSPQAKGAAPC